MHNVLFLCTGNSARSLIAEALLNRMSADEGTAEVGRRFRAFSAGSNPKGAPHPMALEVLRDNGLSTEGLRSKSWHEFAGPGAPPIDLVITVCDNAAGETCPVWPGHPIAAHWGIDDPAAVEGEGQRKVFEDALIYLRARISLLLSLPEEGIGELELRTIGKGAGASAGVRDSE